jgi:DNA-binding MurR/RpiR family transcriptional regulator
LWPAQNLGFSGFLQLRAGLRSIESGADLFPVPGIAGKLYTVAHQDIRNINQTVSHLDGDAFEAVVKMIVSPAHVYTRTGDSP